MTERKHFSTHSAFELSKYLGKLYFDSDWTDFARKEFNTKHNACIYPVDIYRRLTGMMPGWIETFGQRGKKAELGESSEFSEGRAEREIIESDGRVIRFTDKSGGLCKRIVVLFHNQEDNKMHLRQEKIVGKIGWCVVEQKIISAKEANKIYNSFGRTMSLTF